MYLFKYILIFVILLNITACSQKQLRWMYDNKTTVYSSTIFSYEPSVDKLDNLVNPQDRPSYDEYRDR